MIVATAYANSFGKPEATAQYNIDAGHGALNAPSACPQAARSAAS